MTLIATQPVKTSAGASDFFQEAESCTCLNEVCGATIPLSHVVKRIDPRTGRQEVKAVCPYCRAQYEATRVLADNRWKTIAFHMEPAEGFEPAGGTPRPVFPESTPLATHINEQFDASSDCYGDGGTPAECDQAGNLAPEPTPLDKPALEQLDTDYDVPPARVPDDAEAKELTIDTSTSQGDAPDPD